MGKKLESFLRVLGSGLSPQAFQANVGMYQQEKAEESRIAEEQRIAERSDKQFVLKQSFANLGVLGEAAKKANAAGDVNTMHKIGKKVDEITSRFPKYQAMMKESFLAYSLQEAEKGEVNLHTLMSPDGKQKRSFRKDDPNVDKLMQQGWTPAPTRQETAKPGGFTKSQAGKIAIGSIEGEQNLRNNVREIGNLMDTVASPDYVGGVTGDMIQGLNSARQQVSQVFGGEDYLTDDGTLNPEAFSEKGTFRAKAIQGELAESEKLELAFILAKSLNPDGKISDADVRQAGQILGESADPKVRKRLLEKVQKRIVDKYNSDGTVLKRRGAIPEFTPLKLNELTGALPTAKEDDNDSPSSRILKRSGLL
jgi:hypothetical protein